MKLIFKTIFFLALLLGFFSSSIGALDAFYCLLNNCGENSIKTVVVCSIFSVISIFILLNCVRKPAGERVIDNYVAWETDVFIHYLLDQAVLFSIGAFSKIFFPQFLKSIFSELYSYPWYVRSVFFVILVLLFMIMRLMLLRMTSDSKTFDLDKNHTN